jgi:uncharacterized protein (DUF2164 family)
MERLGMRFTKNQRAIVVQKLSFMLATKTNINKLITSDHQLFVENIIDEMTEKFQGFSISILQLNHYLKNTMQIIVKKKNHFEAKARNYMGNLQISFEWSMNWKDTNWDYIRKLCIHR